MLVSAVLGVLTNCSILCAPPPGPSRDELAAVRAVLRRSEGTSMARDDVLVRRLVALGSGAAPALFALATGEGIEALLVDDAPDAWMCPPDRVGALALNALGELPAVPVREFLRSECGAHPRLEARIVALDVLGRQGTAEGLGLFFELLAASGDELEHRALRTIASDALLAMLRRDNATAPALERMLLAAPLASQDLACETLARCNRPAAVGLLGKLFGRDPGLDRAALEALVQLGERFPWRVGDEVGTRLRSALKREDPRMRAAVARALGRTGDVPSFPALIGLLADPDPAVVRAAQWALREISGETRISAAEDWQAWFEAETSWWQERGHARLEAFDPENPARLSEALRELGAHPVARTSVVEALAGAIAELDPPAKLVACGTLSRLGSRRAVPALIECLYDPSEELRTAAWQALCALTGEDLPPEPQLWEAYAFD
jgi:HEAT repeat protein